MKNIKISYIKYNKFNPQFIPPFHPSQKPIFSLAFRDDDFFHDPCGFY